MGFASPIWLLGLLPWGAVVFFLLPGRGRAAVVPFLGLWRGSNLLARRAARRWPRAAVFSAIIALLLTILAAAEPQRGAVVDVEGEVSIVVDRGATMSLPSASGRPLRGVVGTCAAQLDELSDRVRVTLIPVPGQPVATSGDRWQAAVEALSPTALGAHLGPIVADQLRRTRGPILVLSDQHLDVTDKRIIQIFPEPALASVAITAIGASSLPHPQVMLRLENHSTLSTASIAVESDGQTSRQQVALPPRGRIVDQFFDLAKLGPSVRAWIDVAGTGDPWSQAFLVRQWDGVRVAADPSLDESVRRIAKIYSKDRPASADARTVLISNRAIPSDQSGIWIAEPSNNAESSASVVVAPHAATKGVKRWIAGNSTRPPEGFLPVVTVGNHAVVAVRDDSVRQVWLNTDLHEWEKTADFVVFFANALDWIAAGDEGYTSVAPAFLGDDWHTVAGLKTPPGDRPGEWPGIYESPTGGRVAVNAGSFPNLAGVEKPAGAIGMRSAPTAGVSLTGDLAIAALGFLLLAVVIW